MKPKLINPDFPSFGGLVNTQRSIFLFLLILNVFAFKANAQVHTITSFTPLSGKQHDLDTIIGANFHPNPDSNLVFFGSIKANVLAATSTQLIAKVPLGATSDFIYVIKGNRTAVSKRIFQIAFKGGEYLDTSVLKYVNQLGAVPVSTIKHNQIASGDFNNDMAIDLAVVMNNARSRVYINNKSYNISNTSFPGFISLNDSTGSKMVKRFDINSDGKQDIIIVNRTLRKLYIFRNLSNDSVIAFSNPDTLSINNLPTDFDINDFNQDGKIDLVILCDTIALGGPTCFILPNISTSVNTLVFAAPVSVPAYGIRIKSGDFNLDGKIDLIALRNDWTVQNLLLNNSTGTVTSFSNYYYPFDGYFEDLNIADVNADGKPDLMMIGSYSAKVYINLTTSSSFTYFSQINEVFLGGNPTNYATNIIDLNGDGFQDIISCNPQNNSTRLVLNNKTSNPFNPLLSSTIPGNLLFKSYINVDLDTNSAPDFIVINNGINIIKNDYIKSEPSIPSSAMKIINRNGHTIKFKVTTGNGNQRIVIVRKGLPLIMKPTDYTVYAANDTFGRGSQLEPNSFVVYRGNKDTFEVKGLERNTKYYFGIFEVNGNNLGSNYSNSAYSFDTSTTFEVSRQLSNIVFSNFTDSSARISWTKGDGNKRLLLIQRGNSNTNCSPIQYKYYKAGQYGKGDTVRTNFNVNWNDTSSTRWFVMHADTGSYCDMHGLSSGVFYKVKVLEYLDTLNSPIYFYENVSLRFFATLNYAPIIDSIVPLSAKPGDKITVYGNYFDQDPYKNRTNYITSGNTDLTMAVTFGSVKAEQLKVISKKIIETSVPYGATNDFIRVTGFQRGDAYAVKKFQPYFLSRDTFGNGTVSHMGNFNHGSTGDIFNGFAGVDGSNDGIPDYYLGNYRYLYNSFFQSDYVDATNPPNCSYQSYESNIDYDLDLKMDVLYSCNTTARVIYTLNTSANMNSTVFTGGPTLCNNDFNKDSRFDRLVYANSTTFEQGIVMFNNQQFNLPFGAPCRAGNLADLNNDNKVDIIAANYNTGKIMILKNIYDTGIFNVSSFAPRIELSNIPGIEWIECADLDKDGREDFAISNSINHTLSIYKNVSTSPIIDSNSFILKAVFTLPVKPGRFKFQDISGDGKIDIVIAGNALTNGRMTLFINQMNNDVIDTTKFKRFVTSLQPFQGDFKLIDRNLDGKPEIFAGQPGIAGFGVYLNNIKLFNINKLSKTVYNPGDSLKLSYNTFDRTFNSGNVSRVQLLDSSGKILLNNNLGQKTTTAAQDTIGIIIPGSTPSGIYRFRVVTTNVTDTSVNSDFTITICGSFNKPVITSSKGFKICGYDSTQFDLTNKISGIYNWYRNDTLITSNTSASAYFSRSGKYQAILNTSSGCQRISNDTMLNILNSTLSGVSLSRSAIFCKGDSTQITVNTTHSLIKTQWYKNNFPIASDTLAVLKVKSSGLYKAVIIDSNQCSWGSNTLIINANEFSVKLNLTGSSKICQGDSSILLADSNGHSGLKYQWLKNNTLLNDTSKILTIKTPGTYGLKATNYNNCSEYSQDITLVVMNPPVVNLTSNKSLKNVCYYDSLTLNAKDGYSKYIWYRNSIPLLNDSNHSITIKTPGAYRLKVIDSSGCSNFINDTMITFVNNRNMVLQLNKSPNLCNGDSISTFVAANNAYKSFQWLKNNNPLPNDTSILLVVKHAGLYGLQLLDTFSCIHKSNDTLVNIFAAPQVSLLLNGQNRFCSGDSVKINTFSTDTIISYQWKRNQDILPESSPNYNAKQGGRYSLVITNIKGCKSLSADTLIIENALPTINLNNITNSKLCIGDSLYLVAGTNASFPIFKWKINGIILPSAKDSILLIKQDGIYSVSVSDQDNCNSIPVQKTIQFNPLPQVLIQNIRPLQFCYNDSCIISFNKINSNTYLWFRNDTMLVHNNNSLTVKNTSRHYVIVTDTNTCSNRSNSLDVISYPQPATAFIYKQNDTLFSSMNSGNEWMRNDTLLPSGNLPYFVPLTSGAYKVRYTDINGCLSDTSAPYLYSLTGLSDRLIGNYDILKISPNPFENAFTINCSSLIKTNDFLTIEIFNNLGQLIFNLDGKSLGSTFEIDMSAQKPGVYHVIVSSTFGSKSCKLIKTGNR